MIIDPITRQRVVTAKHVGDITYNLISSDSTISEEDIPLTGDWSDFTGSGTASSRTQQMFASSENELFGTDPWITDNAKVPNLTDRGNNKGTTRRRIVKRYATIDANGKAIRFE